MTTGEVEYRDATHVDAPGIAALHADSWRRHYRGAYPESFFDRSLDSDRLAVWTERLAQSRGAYTAVAELAGLAGFVHLRVNEDERFGSLVDNLHVRHDVQRQGIATQLMQRAASELVRVAPNSGLFLWVLEQNTRAQGFYQAIGGQPADLRAVDPPALPGTRAIRMVWQDPTVI